MSNPWDNHPNAKHIDFVLEHVKLHTDKWAAPPSESDTTQDAALRTIWDASWDSAWHSAKDVAWNAVWNACLSSGICADQKETWDAVWGTAWGASINTLLTLFAYDNCAHLLYSDPKEVEVLAKLGIPAAMLLLSACTAISSCNATQSAV